MSEKLPNGMHLGQHVRVYSGQGSGLGIVMVEGEVVGYAPFPTVVVRRGDGSLGHVAAHFDWDDLEDDTHTVTGPDRVRAALIQAGQARREEEKP